MELRVLFFTICCSVVCFTIYRSVVWATIYRSVVCAKIYAQERLRIGGRRVSLRPPNKTQYLKGVEELSKSIKEFSNECGSMQICITQCQLIRSECLRLEHPPPPDSNLKESFCAIRRALELMEDCSENWILKAAEIVGTFPRSGEIIGNCQQHFLEILLDLQRLPMVVNLIPCRSIDISEETKSKIVELEEACKLDTLALRNKVESDIGPGCLDRCLADQLIADPSSRQFKAAPHDIGRHAKEFNFSKTKCIYQGSDGICVYPITFCDKEFVIKMRLSTSGTVMEEDTKLQNEAFFMKKCRHPYAVALLGSWEARRTDCPKVPLLLMEFMERNLDSVIKGNERRCWWGRTGGFPALDAINLVLPVAKVMKYIHEIGVVHLDLKPQNILFTRVPGTQDLPEDVSVKLADFGDARMAKDGVINGDGEIARIGTRGYMDPYLWARKGSVDLFKADVFSFGMVLAEVLTGLSPLDALGCESGRDFYGKLPKEKRGEALQLPKATPKFVKSIVASCWKLEADERPSFDDICCWLQIAEILLLNGCTCEYSYLDLFTLMSK